MKKINIFKTEYVFNEISAEFNYDALDLIERGIFSSIFHAYRIYVNAGYVGIPFAERYEIAKTRTKKEKLKADKFFQDYFTIVENDDIFIEKNEKNSSQNSSQNCSKKTQKNAKKFLKNDYILTAYLRIILASKINQKNGKKGGYRKHKNTPEATAQLKNEFSTTEKNRVATATPFATDFATQKTQNFSSETSRQNSKNSKNNISNNINSNITTNNNSNIEAVVDLQNHEKNQQISQNENFVVDVVEKNQTQNENEKIQNLPIQKTEAQITFDFFVKMLPQFRHHMPNEVFNETFTKGATLQDYRNAYNELNEELKKSIKSINYLASIVSKKQNEPKTNIIPISNSSQVSQVSIEAQLQLALTKRLNMIYFRLNKRREELEKQACNYLLKTGERMPDDLRKQFLLADFTASEIELIKKENVRILPEKEVKDISDNNENLLIYSGEIAF